jgi:hypothetical protein
MAIIFLAYLCASVSIYVSQQAQTMEQPSSSVIALDCNAFTVERVKYNSSVVMESSSIPVHQMGGCCETILQWKCEHSMVCY